MQLSCDESQKTMHKAILRNAIITSLLSSAFIYSNHFELVHTFNTNAQVYNINFGLCFMFLCLFVHVLSIVVFVTQSI